MGIKENLAKIKEQIGNIDVKIIAVTKYVSQQQVSEAYELGVRDFGESYVQEAVKKQSEQFQCVDIEKNIRWHFVGRLQKNKVKYVVGKFCLIHSVDTVDLAELINMVAHKKHIVQNVLLQANISGEPTKGGFVPEELAKAFEKLQSLQSIRIMGLMTIAPNTNDEVKIKECFMRLNLLMREINQKYSADLNELSMGMSNDYKIAVECGATMIRIGRAIFKESLN